MTRSRLATASGRVILAGLVLVLLDVWRGPALYPLPAVVGFAPWLLFAAWAVALAAAAARRWRLGLVAAAIVVAHVVLVLPSFAPWHSPPRAVAATAFRVFDQNVKYDNGDLTVAARQIAAGRPDVVALEELSPVNLPSLERSGVLTAFPYRLMLPTGGRGYGLWSRLPLTGVGTWLADGIVMVHATVAAPGGAVRLLVVHTLSPTSAGDSRQWSREMAAIAARIRSEPGPLLVVGDFNATLPMRQMRAVMATGVRDAADLTGDGWRLTWPDDGQFPFRVFRLDHALLSPGLTVTSYRLGSAGGSDHSPLLFTVARAA